MDRFVIYDPHYPQLRTALLDAAYGQQMDGLKESCQVKFHKGFSSRFYCSSTLSTQALTPNESVPVLLAVYEVVTQSHSYRQQSKHIDVSILRVNLASIRFGESANKQTCTTDLQIKGTACGVFSIFLCINPLVLVQLKCI